MAVPHRFDLYVRFTVEEQLPSLLNSLDAVTKEANKEFAYVLRQYIPDLEIFGCSAPPGGTASTPPVHIRSDEDLNAYLTSQSAAPIFEVRVPESSAAQVAASYKTLLESSVQQVQRLTEQITALRQQGQGSQQGHAVLQQVASTRDDQVMDKFRSLGEGIDICVTALAASPTDQWTNQQGLRLLMHYGKDSPERMKEIHDTNGFPPVIAAMQHFAEDSMIQQHAHHIIAGAAKEPECCAELHKLGVVAPIIRNLNYFRNDPRVQQYGCLALGELASSPENRDQIVQAGGIKPLVKAMRHFPQDPYVNRYAMAALQPLAQNRVYAAQIVQLDGIVALMKAVQYHSGDDQVEFHGIGTIAELARHSECKEQLGAAGAIPVLLQAVTAQPGGGAAVLESALRCLAVLAVGNPSNQAAILQAKGIAAVVSAVQTASASRRVVRGVVAQGLNVLGNLASQPECRQQILQSQGIDVCAQAMRNSAQEAMVQEHGLRVLAGLAGSKDSIPRLMQAGCADLVIGAMKTCLQEPKVQMNGSYALSVLCGASEPKATVSSLGGVEALVGAMNRHPREPHVHEQACAALATVCELESARAAFAAAVVGEGEQRASSAKVVAISLRNMATFAPAAKQCFKLIAVAALNERAKATLVQVSAMDAIVATLQVQQKDSGVLYYGLKAFITLAQPQPPDEAVRCCVDLLDVVVPAMRAFPEDGRLQESGCEVLSLLGRLEPLQDPIIAKGAITAMCSAIRKFEADIGIQRKGCRAFANLAEHASSRVAVRTQGGVSLVVQSMKYHVGHPEVGEQGCAAIANLALDEESRREVARVEGIRAVLAALRHHRQHPGVQAYGLGALGNLAVEEENCMVILHAGAIEMVVYAMTTWPDEPRVQHFACLAFSNFAHDDANKIAIGRIGGNRLIASAMQRHVDHAGVQEQACGALANLGCNPHNMMEIAKLNGIEYVVTALKKHPTHAGVQENACFALSKFLTMPNENYRQRMKAAGAEDALTVIRDGNPSFDVRICVNVLLRRLNEEMKPQAMPPPYGQQQYPGYGQQPPQSMQRSMQPPAYSQQYPASGQASGYGPGYGQPAFPQSMPPPGRHPGLSPRGGKL